MDKTRVLVMAALLGLSGMAVADPMNLSDQIADATPVMPVGHSDNRVDPLGGCDQNGFKRHQDSGPGARC